MRQAEFRVKISSKDSFMKHIYAALALSVLSASPALASTCNLFGNDEVCLGNYFRKDVAETTIKVHYRDPFVPSLNSVNQSSTDPARFGFTVLENFCDDDLCAVYDFTLDMARNPVSSSIDRLAIGDTFSSLQFTFGAVSREEEIGINVVWQECRPPVALFRYRPPACPSISAWTGR